MLDSKIGLELLKDSIQYLSSSIQDYKLNK
jgi:hypothetical protein